MAPGVYLHVPFCQTKCAYCDFYSLTDRSWRADWFRALERETALYAAVWTAYDTLYLGGGTPSCLTDEELAAVFGLLRRHLVLSKEAEITLEANPDDVTPARLRRWRDLGVNRLSLGVQSLHDPELVFLGRRHTAAQAWQALVLAREAGFDNLSADLMYALPGQSVTDWLASLEKLLALGLEHLSCYQLTIEASTPLGERLARGEFAPADEEAQRSFFLLTSEILADAGYSHYEISNFARGEAYCSRHNAKYWRRLPYLGLGPGAHSFDGRVRRWNVRSVGDYCRCLEEGRAPVAGSEVLSLPQQHLEALALGLRTREGVALAALSHFPGAAQTLAGFQAAGLLRVEQGRACPTREGFLVADSLALMLSE